VYLVETAKLSQTIQIVELHNKRACHCNLREIL